MLLAGTSLAVPARGQDEWTLPVPEGTTVHTYTAPSDRERQASRMLLTQDLLIAERGDDLHYLFGQRAPNVEVDRQGRIYVAEPMPRRGRVLLFDAEGEYVRTIGRSGQGPGEYVQPFAVTVARDHLFVFDPSQARMSRWNAVGEHLGDLRIEAMRSFRPVAGLPDGSLVGTYRLTVTGEFDTGFVVAIRVDEEMKKSVEYVRAPWPTRIIHPGFGEVPRTEPNAFYAGATTPTVAVSPDGTVYVSTLDQYQVLAYEPDGTLRWALQVPWSQQLLADEEVQWLMRFHNVRFPQARANQIDWPDRQYVLGDIKVDGHGRLYVFPYVHRGSTVDERPVDVYSPTGERLFSGVISGPLAHVAWQTPPANGPMLARVWQAARGDFIYGIQRDIDTDEWQVVRHRLAWR